MGQTTVNLCDLGNASCLYSFHALLSIVRGHLAGSQAVCLSACVFYFLFFKVLQTYILVWQLPDLAF